MDLYDVILKRRSIRNYSAEPIPEEKLRRIIEAGLLAPTGRNRKPCEFYVIKDKTLLKKLSEIKPAGGAMLADCAAAIVVAGDSDKADRYLHRSAGSHTAKDAGSRQEVSVPPVRGGALLQ